MFAGYWRMPEKTREEFTADGWFRTGDVGTCDADGYVAIVGRAKDLIITGGLNVYPKEIEERIDAMDGVRRVGGRSACPTPTSARRSTAVVVAAAGHRADRSGRDRRAEGARSPASRCPSACIFVDELPRNAMGKVQKNAAARAKLGAEPRDDA